MQPVVMADEYYISVVQTFGHYLLAEYERGMKKEAEKMGDIIKGNFRDTYRNITLKTLFGLKWMTNYCPKAKYLLKCDDDVVINFPIVLDILESSKSKTNTIWGPLTLKAKTMRAGKYYMFYSDYPFYYLPPYMRGSAYVMSIDILDSVFRTAEYVPAIPIDDVYVTGILPKILGINLSSTSAEKWGKEKPTACKLLTGEYIVGFYEKAEDQLATWKKMEQTLPSSCLPTTCGFFQWVFGKCSRFWKSLTTLE